MSVRSWLVVLGLIILTSPALCRGAASEPATSSQPSCEAAACPAAAGLMDHLDAAWQRMKPRTFVEGLWLITGLVGEFVFFLRFVIQWIATERKQQTVVPLAFWYLSLIGTVMVLAYALYRVDPVFILAYGLNIIIYIRNLVIARRQPAREAIMEKTSE